jgi:hypothetical protein
VEERESVKISRTEKRKQQRKRVAEERRNRKAEKKQREELFNRYHYMLEAPFRGGTMND